jgi:hypothetical protein
MNTKQDKIDNAFIALSAEVKNFMFKVEHINELNILPSFDMGLGKDLPKLISGAKLLLDRLEVKGGQG